MVTIKIGGKEERYEDGVKYEVIAEVHQNDFVSQIALVTVTGKIRELMKPLRMWRAWRRLPM